MDADSALVELEASLVALMVRYSEAQLQLTSLQKEHARDVEALLMDSIEILDALDRLIENIANRQTSENQKLEAPEPAMIDAVATIERRIEKWLRSLRTIRSGFLMMLANRGVESIAESHPATAGTPFDPHFHQAVITVTDRALPPHSIRTIIKPGYWYPATQHILRKIQVELVADRS